MTAIEDQEVLAQCRFGSTPDVRLKLIRRPHLDGVAVESAVHQELKRPSPDIEYLQGLANALIALLPSSYKAVKELLSMTDPKAIYELHFSLFGALNRSDFNNLEQDGVEYMLGEYLRGVRSTAAYAAWKAGLVLAEDWLSPSTEAMLRRLMKTARYPAGRLGAINGYRFIVQRRRTFTAEEFAILSVIAERDKSLKVREQADFDLNRLRAMLNETTVN